MRNRLVAALLAASALIPGAAFAQRGEREDYQRGQARQEAQRARPQNERPVQQRQAPQAAPQQAAPQQPRADRGPGGGQWRGDNRGGFRRGDRGGNDVALSPGAAPQRGQFNRDPRRGNDQFRGDRGGNPGQPVQVTRGQDRGTWRDNVGRGNDDRGTRNGVWSGNRAGDRNGAWNGNRNNNWRGNDGRGTDWRGNAGRNDARNGGYRNNDRGWNRNWRQDNRYDWSRRRQYNRNAYHLPRYYAPYGWNGGYRRFGIGFSLSSILFSQNYWIDDADYYGLPEAYGPYRWVRYYNDALLIDIDTGEVVDTVYDIFW